MIVAAPRLRALALLAVLPLLAACAAPATRARVEASAGPDALEPAHFFLRHGHVDADPAAHENHRQRVALAKALEAHGLTRAASPEQCDVIVSLRFGLVAEETPHQGAALEHLFVLDLRAMDALAERAGRPARQLWRVTASAHAHVDQREAVFRALLAAAAPRMGSNGEWDLVVRRTPVTGEFDVSPAP
ncbi:hypothetical protein NNJEOMEG_01300 [Fundidesulfovibrio magnetotacticus]|uniref:DUF4136 domain-containing protein n=1 Tax=Fundidesulfovibrio magnetotacticus TaxID=2730080 RepID=A0A6V8LUX8_9BACT|nr:hypothetical protein [Fundidesulfovibrio magnetotacticus]GFK93467.1 hypothetical protein NNJEOMEG_01300 [Fundidesulfovibrio magnetotacticus]